MLITVTAEVVIVLDLSPHAPDTEIIKFFISQRTVLDTPEQFNMLYGQGIVNKAPTVTDDLIFESGLFRKLNSLNNKPMDL